MDVDTIIRNGHVIDPANQRDGIFDVAIKNGKIFSVGTKLQVNATSSFNATGCIVTPGLIDAHVHCYQYATPLGINPDETCLARGVTTIIDAGSAGASTFMGLKKFIVEKSKTRVRCLLHIALHGLASSGCASGVAGGESDTLFALDEEQCLQCIEENRDVIVGVKVRLSQTICDNGKTENEAFRRALSVSQKSKTPLMVHHSLSTVPTQKSQVENAELGCPINMNPGDIYTHTYHGYMSTIVDRKSKTIHADVLKARSRGVLFDVGHGAGGFSWTVAEIATKEGFWPDMLGTDLHTLNYDGPAYDLPTVMAKFLHLGMSLNDVIKSVTYTPARAYSLDTIGSLSNGKCADITVLKLDECDVMLEDTLGQLRNVKKRLVPVAVWREGSQEKIQLPSVWPNPESQKRSLKNLPNQEVRD